MLAKISGASWCVNCDIYSIAESHSAKMYVRLLTRVHFVINQKGGCKCLKWFYLCLVNIMVSNC